MGWCTQHYLSPWDGCFRYGIYGSACVRCNFRVAKDLDMTLYISRVRHPILYIIYCNFRVAKEWVSGTLAYIHTYIHMYVHVHTCIVSNYNYSKVYLHSPEPRKLCSVCVLVWHTMLKIVQLTFDW